MFDLIKRLIHKRRSAYRALFLNDKALNPAAKIVLADLRRFCRATNSTIVVSHISGRVDPYASAVAEGRREVWNRITQHLHVSDEDLYRLVEQETGTDE